MPLHRGTHQRLCSLLSLDRVSAHGYLYTGVQNAMQPGAQAPVPVRSASSAGHAQIRQVVVVVEPVGAALQKTAMTSRLCLLLTRVPTA